MEHTVCFGFTASGGSGTMPNFFGLTLVRLLMVVLGLTLSTTVQVEAVSVVLPLLTDLDPPACKSNQSRKF